MRPLQLALVLSLTLVRADDIALQEITTANNLFASSLYKTVYLSSKKNFVLSPLSAEMALSIIQSGCKGPTGDEIRAALYLPNSKNEIEAGFKTLLSNFTSNGFYTFHLLSKVYGKKGVPFKRPFKNSIRQVYKAETESIDFSKRAKAAKSMNQWVEKNTKRRIRNVISAGSLSSKTAMMVLSAFYLKANFSEPFSAFLTRKELFHKNFHDAVFVDTMFKNGAVYNLYESVELNAGFLELPFRGGEVSLVIVRPNALDGITNLENNINKVLEPHPFVQQRVDVVLPKFKIDTRGHLKNVLKAMGVNKPFDKKEADLSAAGGKKGSLFVNDVLQKVYFNLEEGGIEVAADSEDGTSRSVASVSVFPANQFVVDRPFVFYVTIKNWIVLVGRFLSPSEQ